MSDSNHDLAPLLPPYLERVISNEATKKGLAAAGAGLLVALLTEAIWPTR